MIIVYLATFLNWKYDIDKIKNRYWSSIFTERYSGSTESKIAKDYKEIVRRFEDDSEMPSMIKNAREILESAWDVFSLKDKDYPWSAIYKWVFNLLFMNNAKDFLEKDHITFSELDDHHIFPKNFLVKKLWKTRIAYVNYDTILNKTLILPATNKKISDKAPWVYLQEMIETFSGSEDKVKKILKDHFIDEQMYEILKGIKEDSDPDFVKDQFEVFISQREKLLKNRIKELLWIEQVEKTIDCSTVLDDMEEDKNTEFKSTLRWNTHQNSDGWKNIEYNVLKTIAAFFNSDGWTLFIWIDDNKNIFWLEKDYVALWEKWGRDWFKLHLDSIIQKSFTNAVHSLVDIEFCEKEGKDFAIVLIKKSNSPVYLNNDWQKEFYIRRLASSIKLDTEEANKYTGQHF